MNRKQYQFKENCCMNNRRRNNTPIKHIFMIYCYLHIISFYNASSVYSVLLLKKLHFLQCLVQNSPKA